MYVEFPDGQVKEYSANVIAENMITQTNFDGENTSMIEAIIDYWKDEKRAVAMSDKYVSDKRGQRRL